MISVFHDTWRQNFLGTKRPRCARSDGLGFVTVFCFGRPLDAGFEVFLTNDSSIEFQQNIKRIGIGVIAIVGFRNRMQDIRPLIPRILHHLMTIEAGQLITIVRE